MIGYVSLHRRIQEWGWYKDSYTFHIFCHILLKANHTDSKFMGETVQRGQLVTGVKSLSEQTGITPKIVRLRLKRLEKTGEISRKRASKYSLITICNYDEYQCSAASKGQAKGKQRASKGQHLNNVNNEKKKKEVDQNEINFDHFWNQYPRKVAKKKARQIWKSRDLGNGPYQKIMKSLSDYKKTEQWQEKELIPHPTTWLNQERWDDEILTREVVRCPICVYYKNGKCKNLAKQGFDPSLCKAFVSHEKNNRK
jgi:hypothetical protein